MPSTLADYRLFFRQFRENFQSTGAIAPSGRWLATALSRYVRAEGNGRHVLEVGPGTGAVTGSIVSSLKPSDRLDLVELNDVFVARLEQRFQTDPVFRALGNRARVLHRRIEELPAEPTYDLIISGLPLNNFRAADVRSILSSLSKLLKPGGTLSFFEYIALRPARSLVSRSAEKQRLREIGLALDEVLHGREIRRDWIFPNLPPAWVHHVRFE
jgi:phosphatidylethanolamine/phosphatidyl-N-methylethanolamine N-methyltransferase